MGACLSRHDNRRNKIENQDRSQANRGASSQRVLGPKVLGMATWDTTVPFVPPIQHGRVIKVYDGDTITVAAVLPYPESPIYRFAVRLNGIDTPEMNTTNSTEKAVAIKAMKALSGLIMGKWVALENTDTDKYGRVLADVWCDGVHVNQWMIKQRYAVAYDGGTKHVPDDWQVYHKGG